MYGIILQQRYCKVNSAMKGFGKNLKNERISVGMSQAELANKIGVKQQQLSQWECDKVEPTLYNIVLLLQVLDVKFEDLLDGVNFSDNN